MDSGAVANAMDKAAILFYQHRINPRERLTFLQFAISKGEGYPIMGQILLDLLDYANERQYKNEGSIINGTPVNLDFIDLANQHLLRTIKHYQSEYLSAGRVNPTELAEYLECWIEVALAG